MTGGATPLTYSWLVDGTNLRLFRGVGDTTLLTIASTGAATFSSSVNIGTAVSSASRFQLNFQNWNTSNSYPYITFQNPTGSVRAGIGIATNNDFVIGRTSGVDANFSNQDFIISNSTGVTTLYNNNGAFLQAVSANAAVFFMLNNSAGSNRGYFGFGGTSTTNMNLWNIENGSLLFGTNNTLKMTLSSGGVLTINNLGSGTVTATSGVLSAVSDMNLKIEDGYINNALDKVMNLKPRYFLWKEETGLPTDLRQLGFYAQEVNEALGEEVANTPKTENDSWGIYDRGIIAMLTKAIQEQQAQIEELKALINK
jgi:hypothetical protein